MMSRRTWNSNKMQILEHPGFTHMSTTEIPLKAITSPSGMVEADLENQRRRLAARIRTVYRLHSREMQTLLANPVAYAARLSLNQGGLPQNVDYDYDVPAGDESRYDEIQQYIFQHRLELALDTMDFPMPENTLFSYILKDGGISIDHVEWRNFLLKCNQDDILFT